MKLGAVMGVFAAVVLHLAFLLFGGLIFGAEKDDKGTLAKVDLVADPQADKPKEEEAKEPEERLEADSEQPPDASEVIKALEAPPNNDAPALEAASLGAIEAALSGAGGGGDFGDALSFASGGRIGGTGVAGGPQENSMDSAFSLAEIDQRPRAVFQAAPLYPASLRSKKLEGVVTLIFIVDSNGRVGNPRVEKSTHPDFNKPALDAVKQWKFEPAVKGGKRVDCKMRVPIRFQPG